MCEGAANVQTWGCYAGGCIVITCMDGYGDCDGDFSNGCETDITTDYNCGDCGITCDPGQTCVDGICVNKQLSH